MSLQHLLFLGKNGSHSDLFSISPSSDLEIAPLCRQLEVAASPISPRTEAGEAFPCCSGQPLGLGLMGAAGMGQVRGELWGQLQVTSLLFCFFCPVALS